MMGVVTPMKWRVWSQVLAGHPDPQFRDFIVKGIRDGFRVGFNSTTNAGGRAKI